MIKPILNPDWAKLPLFGRSKWRRVRFGDIVENLNETERNPSEVGIDGSSGWSIWSRGLRRFVIAAHQLEASRPEFAFDLPPLDQQRRIADILLAVDDTIEGYRAIRREIEITRNRDSEADHAAYLHRRSNARKYKNAIRARFRGRQPYSTGRNCGACQIL